jgi:hypothetical protein
MSIGGPIFSLTWFGRICPCLEKEEDKTGRQAVIHVNDVGQRISWNTKGSEQQPKSFSLGNLFGGGGSGGANSGEKGMVAAKLLIRDNDEGSPEIYVDPLPPPSGQSVGYKLNIALRRIDRVSTDPSTGQISLLAKAPPDKKQSPKTLLNFVLLQASGDMPIKDDERNLFVHNMSVLVEWERQRRTAANIDDDDDEEDQPNFLQARAQKATHFAKREIELQQAKRSREERKAKFVAESGGLKYTALAMASRIDG